MKVDNYVKYIPQIEAWLREYKLDTLVCGLGPTAWLLPWIDQSLLSGIRLWGCHDACRIMPMDDLVVMDSPVLNLNPDSGRFSGIVNARPKRLWVYENNAKMWKGHIPACMESITKSVPFSVCRPNRVPRDLMKIPFKLVDDPLHTTTISPTGTTALAWREGGRRIGVIGVDMQKGFHHTHQWWPVVDAFFRKVADQAHELGGCIRNLSPITALRGFSEWKPPTSGSEPIPGNKQPEPSESSSTPSGSTPPVPSSSTGCEPVVPTGQPASTAEPASQTVELPSTAAGSSAAPSS